MGTGWSGACRAFLPVPSGVTPPDGIIGIDVSEHQDPDRVSWVQLAPAFVFARAAYGIGPDDTFAEHVRRARRTVDPLIGAYHAIRPFRPVVEQVDVMERQMDAAGGCIVPAVDVEKMDGQTPQRVADVALEYVERIEARRGVRCVFYTYPFFVNGPPRLPLSADLAARPLWIAHYPRPGKTLKRPLVPKPWEDWTIWQYDGDKGRRDPTGMDLDFNVYRGTVEQLRAELLRPLVSKCSETPNGC